MPIRNRLPYLLPTALALLASILLTCSVGCGPSSTSLNSNGGTTPPVLPSNQWAWMGGSSTVGAQNGQPGVYGTVGVAGSSNIPGGRSPAASWTDSNGNFWLFGGGAAANSAGNPVNMNDLWKFSPSMSEWTWESGSSAGNPSGVYGTIAAASVANTPGGRDDSVSWADASGNLWLFGGQGNDSAGTNGWLNDLWEFSPGTKEWTWVSGSPTVPIIDGGQRGIYGTLGVAAASNTPGGRWGAVSWTDASGNFWMFGGDATGADGLQGDLNDLWKFSPSSKQWTWMGGGDRDANAGGVYGTQGQPSTSIVPPGRVGASGWTGRDGNFWLFGGSGYDSTNALGIFNDLWEFSPAAGTWTWVSGSSTVGPNGGQAGEYGTAGTAAASNVPGGHVFSTSWIDSSGSLWLFGGYSYASVPALYQVQYHLANELWQFNTSSKEWTWMGGSQAPNQNGGQPGKYGSEGTPSSSNEPSSRALAASWTDSNGNLWLFGGLGFDSTGKQGALNDLWRYTP